jgi:glycosyltransferase involved in cell wall biosynthesis
MPAWNEESLIGQTVLSCLPFGDTIVVNDGSLDSTARMATENGAHVINFDQNVGYDRALMAGLAYAWQQGYKIAITVDADGQHDLADVLVLTERLNSGANVVVGVRPSFQRTAERIFSMFSSKFWGVSDPLCGMKGYDLTVFGERDFDCVTDTVGTKLLALAIRRGLKVEQHPITISRRKGASKFGSGIRPNLKIIRALFHSVYIAHWNRTDV